MNNIFYLLSSFCLTYFLILIILKKSLFINLVDSPNNRKIHFKSIPAIGGVTIFTSIIILFSVHEIFNNNFTNIIYTNDFNVLFFCTILIFFLGFIDDAYDLNVFYKLFFQIIICSIAILMIDFVNDFRWFSLNNEDLGFISFSISLIFMLVVINGINFLDGLDGLLSSLSIIIIISFAILFNSSFTYFFIMIVGSLLAFLKFNKSPAKIFMGDSGSLLIGWMFSLLSFKYASTINGNKSLLIPIIILTLPIVDVLYVLIKRLLVKDYNIYHRLLNIFKADKKHLHYVILDKIKSTNKTVFCMCILNLCILFYVFINNY